MRIVKKDKFIIASCLFFMLLVIVGNVVLVLCNKEASAKDVFEKNANSVIEIKAITEEVGESYGTGEFVKNDGTIVTNAHVVTYSQLGEAMTFQNYFIRFMDSDYYIEVLLVKYDTNLDLAILKYNSKEHKFKAVEFGNSGEIRSGDKVFAVGNAMNYGLAVSSGIVSLPLINLTHASVTRNVIQCDLTIAEGNSGGALFDNKGKLIGITTFRSKDNAGKVVYGFAYCIPISVVINYINA